MKRLLTALLVFVFLPQAFAERVFRWEDEQGVVHYSTKPPSRDAKPAELPRITRGEVKLAPHRMVSCAGRGGVDCRAGADSDGSVICMDGFRGASARFRFTCSSPKLEIADISDLTPDGEFTVFIRNSKSVKAVRPVVTLKGVGNETVKLIGPEEIEPFGTAEYQFLRQADGIGFAEKPSPGNIEITCANCP